MTAADPRDGWQFPPAEFEKWFSDIEAGDGTIPVPQSAADGDAWHEYISRHALALGAWIAATECADRLAHARPEAVDENLTRANIAYAEQVAKLIGRAGNAEAAANGLFEALQGVVTWLDESRTACLCGNAKSCRTAKARAAIAAYHEALTPERAP